MFIFIKNVFRFIKTYGFKGVVTAINASSEGGDVIKDYAWITDTTPIPLDDGQKNECGDKIIVNWVIPPVTPGSGGHTTIFRTISHLERMGIHNRIYIYQNKLFDSDQTFRKFLNEHFSAALTEQSVETFISVDSMKYAHATIATGWQTAYFVRRFNNTDNKFYFVQDFEPMFDPLGSKYLLAENTYRFGFKAITAGDWLKDKMHDEYGMEAVSFGFSCDRSIYKPIPKTDSQKRIFFYARPVTPRRAFEIGLLALNEVYKKHPDIEVVFAGWDVSKYNIPFKHKNMGTVLPSDLAKAFSSSDICLVMSVSNLSLMPLEIMSSGSVCATSYGANNEWLLSEENTILFNNDPIEIADKLCYYLDHRDELEKIREKGMELAASTDWEREIQKVYDYIVKCVNSNRT